MDNSTAGPQTTFKLLDTCGCTDLDNPSKFTGPFYYRILTASHQIKYLGVKGIKPNKMDIYGRELDFETVPDGSWSIGSLTPSPITGKLILMETSETKLCAINPTWHPNSIDIIDLEDPVADSWDHELLCQGKLHATIRGAHFGESRTMVQYEWNPRLVYPLDIVTDIFSRIDGLGIAPKFLAHVTENCDRVIGYMVQGMNGRAATPEDLDACRDVLSKLHSLGIVLGFLHPQAFIITDHGQVFLHQFSSSRVVEDPAEFAAEMEALEEALKKKWEWPKPFPEHINQGLTAIMERDGGLHPLLLLYAKKEGKLMEVTKEEHRHMLETLWVEGDMFRVPPEWRDV
ncbi:uncharacterized protein F4822DRAFT_421062 [Hypoxylon trugodes]|uniref:uncharacterized protein n=1 Tax=Hypoxylon trugodes TaxID=326681 RepID=UPI0021990DC7|nr:uncharacterized protein F4822DRAFT_421062 [Hypoxylon trugodes]KAI1383580.1 hypothetical protein F4822DRAFT_421062 [Hypoxylon trugodes]